MKKEVAKRWIKALRSDKYEQATGVLHALDDRRCCLGVLCDVLKMKSVAYESGEGWVYGDGDDTSYTLLPLVAKKRAGVSDSSGAVQIPFKWAAKHNLLDHSGGYRIIDDDIVSVDLASLNDDGVSFKLISKIIDKFWKNI